MALTAEQIAEARSEGYSDAEILQHYAAAQGIDLKAARDEGYSDSEILSHFSGADVTPQETEEPMARPQDGGTLANPALSAALGAGAGAAYSAKTLPVKAAKALGGAFADKLRPPPEMPAPVQNLYKTPSGIPVEQTPGGLHPGAVGNAQFNIEQQQANQLRQNMPSGFEQRGTSRIITPMGMQEPSAAALGGAPSTQSMSTVNRLRREGWPVVREGVTQAAKTVAPAVGGAAKGVVTSSPAAGAIAGWNLQEAENRRRAGDTTGATLGYVGAGSQLLPKMKGTLGLIKPLIGLGAAGINALRGKPEGYAEGHSVRNKKDLAFEGAKALKNIFTPKQSVETRLSDALSNDIGKWYRPTQADRMRSIEGDLGGIGFSKFQHEKPEYAAAKSAWGVMNPTAATRIANLNAEKGAGNTIWTPMIGSPKQHHSNQHVHDTLVEEFNRQASLGKLTPELREGLNQRAMTYVNRKTGNPIFSEGIDFANPEQLAKIGTTFEKRAAMGELFGGTGVGGRKGSIIPYEDIMTEYMDEATRGVPTHSLGNRLFTLTGEHSYRPDLHSAFPQNLAGEDRAVIIKDLPAFEVGMPDWNQKFLETHGGRAPGFFDKTLGSKKIGYPIQEITEPYLEGLYKAGYAEGGEVKHMADGKLTGYLSALQNMAQRSQDQAQRSWRETASMTPEEMAQSGWEAAKFAGSFNPLVSAGLVGSQFIDAAKGNTGWGEALGNAALNAPGVVGKAAHAVAPYVRQALPYVGGLGALGMADAAEAAPKPSALKGMMDDVVKGFAPKASKEITPGAPHTYGPQATGSWMRDYQPSGAGLPSTPEEWNLLAQARQAAQNKVDYSMGNTGPVKPPVVQYMGKYRKGTPEERAAQRQSDNDTIRMLMKLRGMD